MPLLGAVTVDEVCDEVSSRLSTFRLSSVPELPEQLVENASWRRLVVGAWKDSAGPIHLKECKAALFALHDAVVKSGVSDAEVVAAGDNLAEVIAIDNGRAKSHDLQNCCRHSAALQLCS